MKTFVLTCALCMVFCTALAVEKAHVIQPERLAHYWLLESSSAQARAPNSGHNIDVPACAAVAYTVEKNGSVSNVKLEKLVPPGDLGKVAVQVVAGMRFVATPQNPGKDRVSTYVVIPFNLPKADAPKPADRDVRTRTLAACRLNEFGKHADNVVHIVQ